MVRWAKDQGIRVGPGRGSAAGSLVNYLIRITAIDPIGYGLLFERFLNEYRTEMPDIDIDFQPERRHEVKEYLISKWGSDYVVDIAAFQSFGFKGVIKDCCRALGISYGEANIATRDIPEPAKLFGVTFEQLEGMIPSVANIFGKYPELKKHCYRLHEQMKGQSVHAAAVIVTNEPAIDLIPMMRTKDGGQATQWSERANAQLISPYGFLKIDMLVTDALDTQANCLKLIEERHGVKIDFEDPKQFPVTESPLKSDDKVVAAFASGANLGVFQFASRGIVNTLREVKPTNLEHIIAVNALFRPGPMDTIPEYVRRKNGLAGSLTIHPDVDEFTENTFGLMIYQEQVMQIFRALGKDVEPSAAAVFLKVVAKGVARDLDGKQKLKKYYDQFAEGCEEKGIPQSAYDETWSQILQMTTYAFNRSHAAGYALQAYQDMWLKQNYPLEFYACLLTTKSESDLIGPVIRESRLWGIKVLGPDINTSDVGFSVDGNAIRFGLLAVKNVGDAAISAIKPLRPFYSYEQFYNTVPKQKVNKRVKEALFDAGAFDTLGARDEWKLDADGTANVTLLDHKLSDAQKAKMEKAVLGHSVTAKADVELYKDLIAARTYTMEELESFDQETDVVVGGEIVNVKEHTTKKGDLMGFVDLSFGTDEFSCTLFTEKYADYQHFLVPGNAVMMAGTWDPERRSILIGTACTAAQLAADLKE